MSQFFDFSLALLYKHPNLFVLLAHLLELFSSNLKEYLDWAELFLIELLLGFGFCHALLAGVLQSNPSVS